MVCNFKKEKCAKMAGQYMFHTVNLLWCSATSHLANKLKVENLANVSWVNTVFAFYKRSCIPFYLKIFNVETCIFLLSPLESIPGEQRLEMNMFVFELPSICIFLYSLVIMVENSKRKNKNEKSNASRNLEENSICFLWFVVYILHSWWNVC